MKKHFREISIALALVALLVALAVFAPSFYQPQPLLSLLASEAPVWVVACGIAMVIICRQIDISVGSQFAVCSVCAGLLAALKWPLFAVLPASIVIGAGLGAVNGVLVAGLRLPSIVVTLATMVIWREALRWRRQGQFVNLPDGIQWFGLPQLAGQWLLIALALGLLAGIALALKHLAAGRFVYAVGSDSEAARLAGIRPHLVTFSIFALTGALVGLAAMMKRNPITASRAKFGDGPGTQNHRRRGCGRRRHFGRSRQPFRRLSRPLAAGVCQPGADPFACGGVLGKRHSRRDHSAGGRGRRMAQPSEKFLMTMDVPATNPKSTESASSAPDGPLPGAPSAVQSASEAKASRFHLFLRPEMALLAVVVAEWLYFNATGRNFGTWDSTCDILRHSVEIGLLAIVMTPIILTGGIDLSLGSLLGLCAILFGKLWRDAGLAPWESALCTLAIGALAGGLNAALITQLRLPPLIVTLGTYSLFRGLAEAITHDVDTFTNFPPSFLFLGQERWMGIPAQAPFFAAVALIFWLLVHRTTFGRSFRAIGFSPEGARYAGIPVARHLALAYVLAGLVSALAAILYTARLGQARADAGSGYELFAITAVVLGGTSIFGGVGTVHGTLLGVAAIGVLNDGLLHAGQPREVAGMLTGLLLVVALAANAFLDKWAKDEFAIETPATPSISAVKARNKPN